MINDSAAVNMSIVFHVKIYFGCWFLNFLFSIASLIRLDPSSDKSSCFSVAQDYLLNLGL